jgi:hypothetical protein
MTTFIRVWLGCYRSQRRHGETRWRAAVDSLGDARWVLRCRRGLFR